MSFTINRNINFKAIKKNINISNTININSLIESLGSTGSSDFLSLDSLNINNVTILASANQLNYLQVTPGIANASKGLVLDSNKNITGINILNCSSNIIVNNVPITSNADLNTGSSDDLNNEYLTNTIPGTAQVSKALVVNSKNNISNINKLTTNNIKIKNYNINFHKNNEVYDVSLYPKLNYFSNYYYIDQLFNNNIINGGNFSPEVTGWTDCCWSPELDLFVIVGTSGTNYRVLVSSNGYGWKPYSSVNNNISWNCICWSKELNLFVAGGASGHTMYSNNGLNWYPGSIIISGTIISICWSAELNLFVAVSNSGNIINSSDGINWNLSDFNFYYNIGFTSICWANNLNLFLACGNFNSNNNTNRLLISNNGYTWQPIYHTLIDNSSWNCITWSEELNTLIMTGSSYPQRIIKSNDGINWDLCYPHESTNSQWYWYGITKCIWIKELHIFVALLSGQTGIYYSYSGLKWKFNSIGSSSVVFICWSNVLGSIISGNTSNQIYIHTNRVKTYLSGLESTKETLNINQNNNFVGIGTNNPQLPLHINDSLGKCLRMHPYPRAAATAGYTDYTNYCEFNILSNGQFDINSNSPSGTLFNVNILTDNAIYGLKLNNTLLLPTITEYSYISNITNGIASNSKALVLDSNLNISNINSLSCNTFTVNGVNIDDSNNNQYLSNLTIGLASNNKALITDVSNNIKNINNLKTKIYNLNFDKIYGSEQTSNLNLINLNNKYKIPSKTYIINKLSSSNWLLSTSSDSVNFVKSIWCAELNLFVAIANNGLYTSIDGINWIADLTITDNCLEVCWANEINTLVVFLYGSTYRIFISHDAKSWYTGITLDNWYVYGTSFLKCIWANNIKSFIVVSDNGQVCQGMTSKDGYNWSNTGIPTGKSWSGVCWCDKLNLAVAVANNGSSVNIITSTDLYNWTYTNVTGYVGNVSLAYTTICYSPELNIIVAIGNTNLAYSYNGINWFHSTLSLSISFVIWIKELNMFLGTAPYGSFGYSFDGINWTSLTHPITNYWSSICWSPGLSTLVITAYAGTSRIGVNTLGLPNTKTYLSALPNQLYFDKINSRMGLGTNNPNYQLELSTDNAAKPSTSTWTIVSDSRLKENIELADLDQCYDVIKNLKLKRYKWKDTIFEQYHIYDRTKLGWIADDVEKIFPKAVTKKHAYNLEDCKTLNIDQIIASIYGFSQKLMGNYDNIDLDIIELESKLQNIKNFINDLDI
jgi:hypothetical protein